jgi:type II secretory pathway pseudopilin PulG
MVAWLTALLLLIFIIVILILMISSRISVTINQAKLRLLNQNRGEMSKDAFIDFYMDKGYTEKAISFLYDEVQKNLTRKNFPLHPDDNLHSDYFLHRDYLKEVAIRTFRAVNYRSPNIEEERKLNRSGSADTFEQILDFSQMVP